MRLTFQSCQPCYQNKSPHCRCFSSALPPHLHAVFISCLGYCIFLLPHLSLLSFSPLSHGCLCECTCINQSMPISLLSPSLPAALSITPVLLLACRAHHHLALVPATVVSSSSRMPSSFPPWQSFVSLARSSSCVLVISSLFFFLELSFNIISWAWAFFPDHCR